MTLIHFLIIAALLAMPVAFVLLMYGVHWALDRWGYPSAIVAFAHANPEVLAVIAFLWPSPPWAEDIEKGIADMPELREKYVAAGLSITGGAV